MLIDAVVRSNIHLAIILFPFIPPRSKVEELACQPECQRLRNKRPEFKRTSANMFQLWIWGRGGGNHHNLLRWAIISQTPVPRKSRASDLPSQTGAQNIFHGDLAWRQHSTQLPRKSFSSGLVLQSRAQTTNSRVLFCFRFRAVAHNESVRRTLGTKRSLAPRV